MRTLLSLKKWLLPVASATAVAILIAVMAPTTAGAASLSTSVPLLGSMMCAGSLIGSPDQTDLPNGDLVVIGAYYKLNTADVAPFSQSGSGTVTMSMGFLVGGSCFALTANGQKATAATDPCGQTTYLVGSYTVASKGTFSTPTQPAVISAKFTQLGQFSPLGEPPALGSDPFEGCTATFEVYPYAKGTSSNMTFTGLTNTSGSCKMAGSQISLECENH